MAKAHVTRSVRLLRPSIPPLIRRGVAGGAGDTMLSSTDGSGRRAASRGALRPVMSREPIVRSLADLVENGPSSWCGRAA